MFELCRELSRDGQPRGLSLVYSLERNVEETGQVA